MATRGISKSNQVAVYPGTFDPVTYGHIDLIRRARAIFPRVVVGVAVNTEKGTLFSVEERIAMLKQAIRRSPGVSVEQVDGLAVDFARKHGTRLVIRGLRMLSDFEYEFQMALTNRQLDPHIETVFLMPSAEYSYLSSRLIKEAAGLGADLKGFVPDGVARALRSKLSA